MNRSRLGCPADHLRRYPDRIVLPCVACHRSADRALLNCDKSLVICPKPSVVEGHLQLLTGHRTAELYSFDSLAHIRREGLFAEYVQPGLKSRFHRSVMGEIRCCHAHRIQWSVRQHRAVIRVARLNIVFFSYKAEALGIACCNGGNFGQRMRAVDSGVLLAHDTQTDYADTKFAMHAAAPGFAA